MARIVCLSLMFMVSLLSVFCYILLYDEIQDYDSGALAATSKANAGQSASNETSLNIIIVRCPIQGDHKGGDMPLPNTFNNVEAPQECHAKCKKTAGCNGWTFDYQKGSCYLKSEYSTDKVTYSTGSTLVSGSVDCEFNQLFDISKMTNYDSDKEKEYLEMKSLQNGTEMCCYRSDDKTARTARHYFELDNGLSINNIIKYDINNFLQQLLNNQTLKIFVMQNCERTPNLYTSKCAVDIDFVSVCMSYYTCQNGDIKDRKCNKFNSECQANDFLFALNYLHKQQNINKYKYVLWLEDDVTFCPKTFESIYNMIRMDALIDSINVNLVFLGHGSTTLLIKTTFIPTLIEYVEYYLEHQIYNDIEYIINGHTALSSTSIDGYLKRMERFWNVSHNSLRSGIFSTMETITYHSKYAPSIIGHNYKNSVPCYAPANMKPPWIYFIHPKSLKVVSQLRFTKPFDKNHLNQCYTSDIKLDGFGSFNVENCTEIIDKYLEMQKSVGYGMLPKNHHSFVF